MDKSEWIDKTDRLIDQVATLQKQLNIAQLALSHIRYNYADNRPDPTNERHWFRNIARIAQEEIEKIK